MTMEAPSLSKLGLPAAAAAAQRSLFVNDWLT
jgi:hypothetical protein